MFLAILNRPWTSSGSSVANRSPSVYATRIDLVQKRSPSPVVKQVRAMVMWGREVRRVLSGKPVSAQFDV
ncbi:hypothetical protein OUZ56_005246 [Daphnia magna]|uniref:Uncharacterized protein n=1 Tax=Daphnia magna TaxID=35525 RepID=A0ABQ9YSB2_9CRUS|nr:hypothetical protein OUZ56_005246 [Daphnia magna]